ncbi:TRAP transporter small permease [Salipiger sp.]|uniref:TRAP transporter small permease n=1 Tax=Salipiger sp. TaxID=2078585 RepID=UPI003A969680
MIDDTNLPHGILRPFDRALRVLELVAVLIAAIFLVLTMLLVSADALMRYAFNNPLIFQMTLTEDYLLVGLLMLALPWGFRTAGYIRISGLAQALPSGLRNILLRAGLFVSAGYIAVMCWQSGEHFWHALVTREVRYGDIDWPVWLSYVWVPVGLGLLALRLLLTSVGPAGNLNVEHDPADEI